MKYCLSCGKQWVNEAKFCVHCGLERPNNAALSGDHIIEENVEQRKGNQERASKNIEKDMANQPAYKLNMDNKVDRRAITPSIDQGKRNTQRPIGQSKLNKRKKLLLISVVAMLTIGVSIFFFIINNNSPHLSAKEKNALDRNKELIEAREYIEKNDVKEVDDSQSDLLGDLNGYWYDSKNGEFISFKITDSNSGELTYHNLDNNPKFAFDLSENSDGIIKLSINKGLDDINNFKPFTIKISFSDDDNIQIDDKDLKRKLSRSNEEALFNKYNEYQEEQLNAADEDNQQVTSTVDEDNNLEITEGDNRIPDLVAVGIPGDYLGTEILKGFFNESNITYSILESQSEIIDAQYLGEETSYRGIAANILMGFNYIDKFGDSLRYTQPYKRDGDNLVVFAFPKEKKELRDKLDSYIGKLKDSGIFKEMYEKHIATPLDEEVMQNSTK